MTDPQSTDPKLTRATSSGHQPTGRPGLGAPVLVVCAHGSRSATARTTLRDFVADLADARPGVTVRAAYVDLELPNPQDVMADLAGARAVLVPVLLTAGYHVRVDLRRVADRHPSVALAAPLSPHPRVVDLLVDRLTEAGGIPATSADRVLVVSAGSSDRAAIGACHEVTGMLGDRLGVTAESAFMTAAAPDVATAVTAASTGRRPGGRVLVALHLLVPGHFAALARHQAMHGGADLVGEPLLASGRGANPALVEVVLERYDRAVGSS